MGALEETVTVSGQAPLVDVQSTARAEVLDREILDAIPTGNTLQSTAQLITGIKMNRPEVGLTTAAQQTYMSVHGMSPSQVTIQVDGQNMNSIGGDGAVQSYHNHLANQEMVYETSGMSAETSGGGVRINMVPREGGNAQSGQLWFGGSHDSLQRDGLESLSQDVQNRGVTSTEGISMMYDMNLVHGGPLVRDKLWYFGSVRNFQIDKKVTNSFWRFDPTGSVPNNWHFAAPRWFDPDPQKLDGTNGTERIPGIDENTISSGLLRLTYQASQNNKFSAHIDRVFKERYSNHDSNADIATAARHQGSPIYYTGSAKWTSTISSRLLLEAGYSTNVENWDQNDPPGGVNALGQDFSQDRPAGWLPCFATPCFDNYGHAAQVSGPDEFNPAIDPWYGLVMRHDQSTGYRDRYHWGREQWRVERFNYNIGLSYVTGSHNIKLGTNNSWGPYESYRTGNGDIERLMYRNGVPEFARVSNRPIISGIDYARDMGIFAQDTWTIDRLTLNLGVRWEQMIAHTYEAGPSVTPGPRSTITQNSRFVAAQQFASRRNLPNWKDFAPRLGLSYDVFGDASTAFKVSWGRYNAANTFTYAQWFNPVAYQRENRNWVDCASLDGRACLTQADLMGMGLDPGIAFGGSTANGHTIGPDGTVWNGGTNGDGFAQDWEIGSPRRANFGGLASRPVEHPDGVERNWVSVLNVGIQRELFEGFSASFNWYRRDTYDSVLRVNRALGFDDFTGFLMDNPCATDPNRGFLSCNQSGGLVPAQISVFNLNPESDGIADDWVVQNTPTGDNFSEVYNGFETGFNARLPNGSTIFGGWVMERNVFIRCDIPHDPNRLLFCDPRGRNDMIGGVPITQPGYSIPFLQEFKDLGDVPAAGQLLDQRVGAVLPRPGGGGGGLAGPVGRHPPRRRAVGRASVLRQHQLQRHARERDGQPRHPPHRGHQRAAVAGRPALLRSLDPGRPLGPADVHTGQRDAGGPPGRPVQHHQLPADPERHQHLRRLAGPCVVHHSGPVRPVRDEHPLVVAAEVQHASRKWRSRGPGRRKVPGPVFSGAGVKRCRQRPNRILDRLPNFLDSRCPVRESRRSRQLFVGEWFASVRDPRRACAAGGTVLACTRLDIRAVA